MATDQEALILQVSADVTRLQKQFDKAAGIVNDGAGKMEKRAKGFAKSVEEAFAAPNLEKSLTRMFDSARLATFEEGGAKLKVFGSALEPLGGYGLAAAGAIAALGVAFEESRKAAEFADSLDDTAHKLHVTTDALQEYRYAVFAAGGTQEGADQALEEFSATLGKAQEGLVKGQRAFLALGFTKAQIKSFTDTDDALRQVIQRISELKSPAQQDAVIQQLGLQGMKSIIIDGIDALDRFRAKAHEIGIVMDADMIKRGAEANKQFETLEQVVSVQLKSAFIDLAPALTSVLTVAVALAREIADIVDKLQSIENTSTRGLYEKRAALMGDIERRIGQVSGGDNSAPLLNGITEDQRRLAEIDSQLSSRRAASEGGAKPGATRTLVPQGKTGGSKYDIVKASQDAIAQAMEAELQARRALTASAEQELAIEQQTINTAADKKVNDLKRQAIDKKITEAAAKQAIDLTNQQRDEQLALAARQADWKLEDQQNEVRKALLDAQIAELQAQADITSDQQQRAKLEEQILRLKHLQAWQEQGAQLSRDVQTGAKTQGQADDILAAGDTARAAETRAKVYQDTYQPIHDALDAAVRGGWPGLAQYMADKLKAKLVDTLADVFTNQLLNLSPGPGGGGGLASLVSSAFHFLGFADGGSPPVGVPSIVGERGPELFVPKVPGTIIPSGLTASLASSGGFAGQGQRGGQTFNIDLRGAVVTQDLLDQVNALARNAAVGIVTASAPTIIRSAHDETLKSLGRRSYNALR